MKRVADCVIEKIQKAGAEHVFFVPGGGCKGIVDALAKNENIRAISLNHEQAAGMAALTYAQITGKIGVCVVTTGCGGTNAITALLHAYQDSIPCVFISGQVEYKYTIRNSGLKLRQFGIQEANIIEIVSSICKYAVTLTNSQEAIYEIEKAIAIAQSGRKGPVWIDIPLNIQADLIDLEQVRKYCGEKEHIILKEEDVQYIVDELSKSERPIILAGNGIKLGGAAELFNNFIEKYKLPVVYSRLGNDILDSSSPYSIGMVGSVGASRSGSFAIQNADFVLAFGCRLSPSTTGYDYERFVREGKIAVVDIDEEEHKKQTVSIEKFIHADVKEILSDLFDRDIELRDISKWRDKCLHWKNVMPILPEKEFSDEQIDMYQLAGEISNVMPEDVILICDAGNAFYIGTTGFEFHSKQTCITSGGQAEMGYALPGAIGASFATERPILVFCGDGSIMMNLQELATVKYYNIPMVIVIVSNNGYSCIKKQHMADYRRYIGCDASGGLGLPSFERIAYGFEIDYLKISDKKEIASIITKAFSMKRPVIVEAFCKENQNFLSVSLKKNKKRRFFVSPIEDQAPFLDQDVFEKEMIIKPIE